MKQSVELSRLELRFPEPGWRERLLAFVASHEARGLDLKCELAAGATPEAVARLEGAVGRVPADLRALLAGTDGGRLGALELFGAAAAGAETAHVRAGWSGREGGLALDGVRGETLFAFARDFVGGIYALVEPAAGHAVVYLCREPQGSEHRFSTLGRFLEAALARAEAAALHRKAEVDRGDDIDDAPWIAAARDREARIDPKLRRTRED